MLKKDLLTMLDLSMTTIFPGLHSLKKQKLSISKCLKRLSRSLKKNFKSCHLLVLQISFLSILLKNKRSLKAKQKVIKMLYWEWNFSKLMFPIKNYKESNLTSMMKKSETDGAGILVQWVLMQLTSNLKLIFW